MNESFVIEKQSVIKHICEIICTDKDLIDDLVQELSLHFLTTKLPDEVEDGYIYWLAYKMYNLSGSAFKRLYNDWHIIYLDATETNIFNRINETNNIDEQYENLKIDLSDIDQVWIEEFKKRDCNVSMLALHSNINRLKVKQRIESVYKKIRNNGSN